MAKSEVEFSEDDGTEPQTKEDEDEEEEDLIDEDLMKIISYLNGLSLPTSDEINAIATECPLYEGDGRDKFVILDMDETLLSAVVDTDPDYYSKRDEEMEPTFTVKSNHKNEILPILHDASVPLLSS